jgi:hypothetical protein
MHPQTNSGIGDYEFSEIPVKEDEAWMAKNENRVSGASAFMPVKARSH